MPYMCLCHFQELLNSLFSVTPLRVDDVLVAPMPPPEFRLPRAKPVPKPRPPTKWERYAKEKGIQKKKRTKVVWDDAVRQWVPRYGYKKARAEEQKNWMMPYKGDAGDDAQVREKTSPNALSYCVFHSYPNYVQHARN